VTNKKNEKNYLNYIRPNVGVSGFLRLEAIT
jgi:hypothetical protein